MFRRIAVAISIAIAVVFAVAPAGAAELKVMGAGPVEGTVKELVPAFVHETGHKVEGVFNTVGFIQDRLKAGERPDILILSAPVIEAMEKDGSLVAGSRTEIRRATSGFAVRASGLHPLCVVWKGVDVGNLARLREHLSVPIVEFDSKPPSGLGSMVGLLRSGLHTPLTAPYQFDIARTASGASEVGTLP
jgi:hypothetical protein